MCTSNSVISVNPVYVGVVARLENIITKTRKYITLLLRYWNCHELLIWSKPFIVFNVFLNFVFHYFLFR